MNAMSWVDMGPSLAKKGKAIFGHRKIHKCECCIHLDIIWDCNIPAGFSSWIESNENKIGFSASSCREQDRLLCNSVVVISTLPLSWWWRTNFVLLCKKEHPTTNHFDKLSACRMFYKHLQITECFSKYLQITERALAFI